MRKNLLVKTFATFLLVGGLAVIGGYTLRANDDRPAAVAAPVASKNAEDSNHLDTDTAEDVMQAGKNGVAGCQRFWTAIKEAQAIPARLAQDKDHAAKVLELARKNDRAGLAALFQKDTPAGQIEINEIKDFTVRLTYKRSDGTTVVICTSSDNGCNGRSFVLLV